MSHWDKRFMELAHLVATWSKDRSRGIGCAVIGPDKEVRALGYNGFPRGVEDNLDHRHKRPDKYFWTEHAERNAVFNASRTGTSLVGCTAFSTLYPCADCARAIIQSGIRKVVTYQPDFTDPVWGMGFQVAQRMFDEAGVMVQYLERETT